MTVLLNFRLRKLSGQHRYVCDSQIFCVVIVVTALSDKFGTQVRPFLGLCAQPSHHNGYLFSAVVHHHKHILFYTPQRLQSFSQQTE